MSGNNDKEKIVCKSFFWEKQLRTKSRSRSQYQ